jgi:hypothetical protein
MNNFYDKYLGTKFKHQDEEGNYLGCLLPIYLLYPKSFRFKPSEKYLNEVYIFKNISKEFTRVDYPSNFGDVVITKNFGNFHFFVFVDSKHYAHISEDRDLQYMDIRVIKNKVIGVYRHKSQL